MIMKRIYDSQYNKFRKEVIKRDKKCQMPRCKSTKNLEVHHILPYSAHEEIRTNTENAILLCKKCHSSIKNKEYFFVKLFRIIIKRNMGD